MKRLSSLVAILLCSITLMAQTPEKFKYQAVIRDASDALITNQAVSFRFTIENSGGTTVYQETNSATTNDWGLANMVIGDGTAVLGSISSINWGNSTYSLKIEIDETGGSSYSLLGTSDINSIPYALHAKTVENDSVIDDDNDPTNERQSLSLSNDSLGISDMNKVDLSGYLDNTDSQMLSLSGDTIYLTGGGFIVLPPSSGGSGHNTLQEAYNEGSPGAGRTILTNSGAVNLGGSNNRTLEVWADSTYPALVIQHEGDSAGLYIHHWGTDPAIEIKKSGFDNGIYIEQAGIGHGAFIEQKGFGSGLIVTNTSDSNGVWFYNSGNGIANLIQQEGDDVGLWLLQNGDGTAQVIVQNSDSIASGIWNYGTNTGQYIQQNGNGIGLYVDQYGSDYGMVLVQYSDSIAMGLWNYGDAAGLNINQIGHGVGLYTEQFGDNFAQVLIQNSDSTAFGLWNYGEGVSQYIQHHGAAHALYIDQFGDGDAAFLNVGGTGDDGLHIMFDGTGHGINVEHGKGIGVNVDNAGMGKAMKVGNFNPMNTDFALEVSHGGMGSSAMFINEDVNTNMLETVVIRNKGAGKGLIIVVEDEISGKVNSAPALEVVTNGKGRGIDIKVIDSITSGADMNMEPALSSSHFGMAEAGLFETPNPSNTLPTVSVKNDGTGNGVHIESYGLGDVGTALYVEMAGGSTSSSDGRTAHFDSQDPTTAADAAVLISTNGLSAGHTALNVVPATTMSQAANFEGNVDIAGELEVAKDIKCSYIEVVPISGSMVAKFDGHVEIDGKLIVIEDVSVGDTLTALIAVISIADIGTLTVTSSITAPSKAFKIDHPLDPDNMYLYHNSIESNERINIYSGNIVTDKDGYATVELPEYMCALNGNFRYQLTVLGQSFARAIIWEEIDNETNTFIIKTDEANIKLSWQVTGERIDKWSKENPLEVEVNK